MRLLPRSPHPTPRAQLPQDLPRGRGRGRGGWGAGLLQGRVRARGPGRGQLCGSRDAKSGLGRGGHEGDVGALRPHPGGGRSQALGGREAAPAGRLLLPPGPHLSRHPPRTPMRAGGSGFGRGACARPPRTLAPPSLAAGRGRGRGRVRAGPEGRRPAPPRPHDNERAPSLWSCQGAEPTGTFLSPTNYPVAEGDRAGSRATWAGESTTTARLGRGGKSAGRPAVEPGWGPGSRRRRGAFEEVSGIRAVRGPATFSH